MLLPRHPPSPLGEEAEQSGPVMLREVGKLAAPLDGPGVCFAPGSSVRVDAVVRTRKIGHFFPGGTVDGFDVWLEFQARDAKRPHSGVERQGGGQRPRPG